MTGDDGFEGQGGKQVQGKPHAILSGNPPEVFIDQNIIEGCTEDANAALAAIAQVRCRNLSPIPAACDSACCSQSVCKTTQI